MAKMNDVFNTLETESLPKHVAIIMDGNGRWAKQRHLPRAFGHRAGVERVKKIVRTSSDIGIKVLTLYAFSTENWKRPADEVNVLMSLLVEYLRKEIQELHQNKVRILTIGDESALPPEVYAAITDAKELTKNNSGLRLVIALNYGARAEITSAVKTIAAKINAGELSIEEISEQTISDELFTSGLPDPDLIIRTSGEERLSNFLLYQSAYAELYFTEVFWPDFDDDEYFKALKNYESRSRRYGAV